METDYDVIIAGGGVAGLIVAASVAKFSNQNLRVLVVDRNPGHEIGKKTSGGWTCGDAVSKRSIDFLAKEVGIQYGAPEIEHPVKGIMLHSPDHETSVMFEGEGYILNRKLLPQRQLRDAKKLGIEFIFGASAERLYAENNYVRGVEVRNTVDNSVFRKTARMVVDATGSASRLRTNLPIKSFIQREIDKEYDMESTGRYILTFGKGKEDKTYFDPDFAIIHFDQLLAPGGYAWVFPKEINKANIGLGVQQRFLDKRNRIIGKKDTLQSLIDEYVKTNPAIKDPVIADGPEDRGNGKSSWQVPVRRQNDCLVANGYAIVGDAAWMPRPIDAGGIGPAIYASVILGRIVAEALEANDVSESGLWRYNTEYMKLYGYQMASFEILRRFMQTLTNQELNYGMKHFLSEEDIEDITRREHPEFEKATRITPRRLLLALPHLGLARGLKFAVEKHHRLKKHNLNYPEQPEGFPAWHAELMKELNEAYQRFHD